MKINNYNNPHQKSKPNPLINSWDLMQIIKQLESECKRRNRNLRKIPKRRAQNIEEEAPN